MKVMSQSCLPVLKTIVKTWDKGEEEKIILALPLKIDLEHNGTQNAWVHQYIMEELQAQKKVQDFIVSKNTSDEAGTHKITYVQVYIFLVHLSN